MIVLIWIAEGTWRSAVDAARDQLPAEGDTEIRLLYVTDDHVAGAAHGAFAGLLGRGRPGRDPGDRVEEVAKAAASELLDAAAERLDRPVTRLHRHGRVEHEVVREADGVDLLVAARDGDRDRLGPHSLGPAARFVVDHAPCAVLLVWPAAAPGIESLPPPPP
ncbi:universal stress protein [Streptomyces sp. NPDC007983]|uniref:universal stress protein n=1 Tax=Streptomyces sp. NPDC007983 TaxID=3364800 RepID=UPI0036EADD0D